MRNVSRILAFVLAIMMALAVVTGCSKQEGSKATEETASQQSAEQTTAAEEKKLDPVELIYYTIWVGPDKDVAEVNEAMNAILKEKINATIKINAVDIGSYDQKMNVIASSGENYDLAFTAYWMNNYYKNVAKNAFIPLDDMLPQYAPNLWKIVPQSFWDAARVKGKIFGAINYQIGVDSVGMEWDTEFMKMVEEKTGFKAEFKKYKTLEELEPVFEAIKKANIPSSQGFPAGGGMFTGNPVFFGYDTIGDNSLVGWVKLEDSTLKVVNQYDSEEYKNYIKLMKKWYDLGYIRKDAAVAKGDDGKFKYRGPHMTFVKPGQDEMLKVARGREFITPIIREPVVTTNRASATMIGVAAQSKNPERALMYLDLMATDEQLFNTFVLGIEKKHYVKTGPKAVDFAPGLDASSSTYNPGIGWAFGNQFLEWLKPGIPENVWEETQKLNESAKASPLLGFSFDPEPIKTEMASCKAVIDEFINGLDTGSIDPEKNLPQMLDKLKAAGADKVIAEKQKQVDAWKATKK